MDRLQINLKRCNSAVMSMPNENKLLNTRDKTPRKQETKSLLKKITASDVPSNVRVIVRCRPFLLSELNKSPLSCIKIHSENKMTLGKDREFYFDTIYTEKSTQEQIFRSSIRTHLDKSLEGYNFSAFAYGQTGSGKSYTMGTHYNKETGVHKGMIQLSVNYIFDRIKQISNTGDVEFIIKVSFIEIYNEDIRDLLNIKTPSKFIHIRDSPTGSGVILSGISEISVSEPDDIFNLLWSGTQSRKTASTLCNDSSSRSHAIFMLNLERYVHSTKHISNFRINFIDLAGSEKVKKSGATGDRFKEAVSINSGLLCLGKVIMALAEESKKCSSPMAIHVPYRESKLTRILKDSLGGNSISVMLACISPSSHNMEETINTLNYSSFAKIIKIQPTKNESVFEGETEELIEKMKREIIFLKTELDKYKGGYLESENYKLKGIIKLLRKGSNVKSNYTPDNQIEEVNEEQESLFTDTDLNLNEILEKESQNLLELKISDHIKDNLKLKQENEALKNELLVLEERLSQAHKQQAYTGDMIIAKDGSKDIVQTYNGDAEGDDVPSSKRTNQRETSEIILNKDIISRKPSHFYSTDCKTPNEPMNKTFPLPNANKQDVRMSSVVANIYDKIKKLKDFQSTLRNKIIENEIHKVKVIRNKNEEITYVKRENIDKARKLKQANKLIETNEDKLHTDELVINYLRNDLRNASQEIKILKNRSKDHSPLISHNTIVHGRSVDIKSPDSSNFHYTTQGTVVLGTKKNAADASVYMKQMTMMRSLLKFLDDALMKKHKVLKKQQYIEGERKSFQSLIKINEENLLREINELNKMQEGYESSYTHADDREKVALMNKIKSTANKITSFTNRIDNLYILRDNTLREINSSEEILKMKLTDLEEIIQETKIKIFKGEDYDDALERLNYNDLLTNTTLKGKDNPFLVLNDMNAAITEQDEQCRISEMGTHREIKSGEKVLEGKESSRKVSKLELESHTKENGELKEKRKRNSICGNEVKRVSPQKSNFGRKSFTKTKSQDRFK